MSEAMTPEIDALLTERREFPSPPEFAARSNATADLYQRADDDFEAFWADMARQRLSWDEDFKTTLQWELPYAKWFVEGKLNAAYNCVDRHVENGLGSKVAYHWEGEPGDTRTITFADLQREVSKCANALLEIGVKTGDRVGIYMGMVPELPIAMLACARIGAPHVVVFGGYSADAVQGRMVDAEAVAIITCDGAWRGGKVLDLKSAVDVACAGAPTIKNVLVVKRTGNAIPWTEGRDHWWHELVEAQSDHCPPVSVEAEHLLYLLHTSGTTAKPKGVMHTTGGYLTGVSTTHYYIFDIKPDDVYWCAADIGWVTGHSYIVYGPLANAATSVMYEGAPMFPAPDRWWSMIEKYKVSILYCAPTAIRAFMKQGEEYPADHDMSSLRLIGTVGEPINPEAWLWYHTYIGGGRCPVVDTWWQTETGMILISALPGLTTLRPGSATQPFPGVAAKVVDADGQDVPNGTGGGYLVLTRPWPSMLRGVYKDPDRYFDTYWARFPGSYFAGDGCKVDADGYFWLLGRVDDVMKVSGHRISTTEVESALVDHPAVAEAAVCGRSDPVTNEAIFAYVILKASVTPSEELSAELREHVAHKIGAIARPKQIMFTPELPKTRSGKIMRRLLRDIAEKRPLGDVTTLADTTIVETIRDKAQSGDAEQLV
ncbi:MAG TPA: acetate--CoA ligase [Candidatus Limnocylindrales bacterium]|nr:acetate--CoA ligase [Candidatus Limnocylindrales bacterium]